MAETGAALNQLDPTLAGAAETGRRKMLYQFEKLRRKAAQNIVTWKRTGRPDYPVVHGTRKP